MRVCHTNRNAQPFLLWREYFPEYASDKSTSNVRSLLLPSGIEIVICNPGLCPVDVALRSF